MIDLIASPLGAPVQLGLPLLGTAQDASSEDVVAPSDIADRVVYPKLPHPIPYQGSKRLLAPRILSLINRKTFGVIYEPFAGSAAITLAAAHNRLANRYVIADSLEPLSEIWKLIISDPVGLSSSYERLWLGYSNGDKDYFLKIRDEFNEFPDPAKLLYLLARCVKNAPRFNRTGGFNQSADPRRSGMRPEKMHSQITGASRLLGADAVAMCGDFEETISPATSSDLVYMDPPYEGTTTGQHKRYHQGLDRERLTTTLIDLANRGVPFILSYDGRCGETVYGEPLPAEAFNAVHLELNAGRSSQSTLSGRNEVTIESLYVSRSLLAQ